MKKKAKPDDKDVGSLFADAVPHRRQLLGRNGIPVMECVGGMRYDHNQTFITEKQKPKRKDEED